MPAAMGTPAPTPPPLGAGSPASPGASSGTKRLFDWVQLAANVATAATLVFTVYQLRLSIEEQERTAHQFSRSIHEQQITRTTEILKAGREMTQEFHDGKATPADVINYYYQIYVLRHNDLLASEMSDPLMPSIEKFIALTPQIKAYWESPENEVGYAADFVARMNQIIKGATP
jgi:hypothetical protein